MNGPQRGDRDLGNFTQSTERLAELELRIAEDDVREVEVFGRRLLVERTAAGWNACVPGGDGKGGPVSTTLIPSFVVTDDELLQYLADLWHEDARPDRKVVRWIR